MDSWAVLAWLKDEPPAADRVQLLFDAVQRREMLVSMNIVNLGEVYYLCAKRLGLEYADRVIANLKNRVRIVPAGDSLVLQAAAVKARYPISYADAFAAVTAVQGGVPLVSGDEDFRLLEGRERGFRLDWIGGSVPPSENPET